MTTPLEDFFVTHSNTNPSDKFGHGNASYDTFSARILAWFDKYGRHDLPWQQHHKADKDKDIYAVWLSEIMLQQTQVATVIDYFKKFSERFCDVHALASADSDEVMALWAGLGYYARARNLHAGAKQLSDHIQKHGHYPATVHEWQAIKGVGQSTAGAIVAMGVGGFGVICDGNVKRVLTRWAGIDGDITKSTTDKQLWQLAHDLTPKQHSGRYAQAMMDMGATLCTRTRPKCEICPIASDCTAFYQGNPTAYPVKIKKSAKPTRHSIALFLTYKQKTLWLKRPKDGIWGELWCVPMTTAQSNTDIFIDSQIHELLAINTNIINELQTIKHTLTHFHWLISPYQIALSDDKFYQLNQLLIATNTPYIWTDNTDNLAIPTAMHKLLKVLN